MSTRGLVGWVIDGSFHGSYNHSDSYPTCLGQQIYEFVRLIVASGDVMESYLKKRLKSLIDVKDGELPSLEVQDHYVSCGLYNKGVSRQSTSDWYCLLRNAQGTEFFPQVLAGNLLHFVEYRDFLKQSLFCEWGWVLNFDTRHLEIYKGLWQKPGKYSEILTEAEKNTEDDGYYPCERIRNIPFEEVENDKWMLSACFKNGDSPAPKPTPWELPKETKTEAYHLVGAREAIEPAPLKTKKDSVTVSRLTLINALMDALAYQSKIEKNLRFASESEYLAILKNAVEVIRMGGDLKIQCD